MYCNGSYGCGSAIVYGNNCSFLVVELDTGNSVGRELQVYAPGNNGNVTVITKINGGDDAFRDGRIRASLLNDTNEIVLNCNEGRGNDECRSVRIYGEEADSVKINCNPGTECQGMDVYCPYYYNDDNINGESKPCQINCINTTQCDMDIFTDANNWRKDIDFNCQNCDLTTNTVNVYCNYLTANNQLCTIKNDTSQFMECISSEGYCQVGTTTSNPTQYPNIMPSSQPTVNPFPLPTSTPTAIPTTLPTATTRAATTKNESTITTSTTTTTTTINTQTSFVTTTPQPPMIAPSSVPSASPTYTQS